MTAVNEPHHVLLPLLESCLNLTSKQLQIRNRTHVTHHLSRREKNGKCLVGVANNKCEVNAI